jgi:hypothetical protein
MATLARVAIGRQPPSLQHWMPFGAYIFDFMLRPSMPKEAKLVVEAEKKLTPTPRKSTGVITRSALHRSLSLETMIGGTSFQRSVFSHSVCFVSYINQKTNTYSDDSEGLQPAASYGVSTPAVRRIWF